MREKEKGWFCGLSRVEEFIGGQGVTDGGHRGGLQAVGLRERQMRKREIKETLDYLYNLFCKIACSPMCKIKIFNPALCYAYKLRRRPFTCDITQNDT